MKRHEMADLPDGSGKHCAHRQRSVITVHTRKGFNAAARFARANKMREDQIAAIFEILRGLGLWRARGLMGRCVPTELRDTAGG